MFCFRNSKNKAICVQESYVVVGVWTLHGEKAKELFDFVSNYVKNYKNIV